VNQCIVHYHVLAYIAFMSHSLARTDTQAVAHSVTAHELRVPHSPTHPQSLAQCSHMHTHTLSLSLTHSPTRLQLFAH
jgi:hypothetical protein